MVNFVIRHAKKEDCNMMIKLIQDLADYEEMSDGPKINVQTLQEDGFGKECYFKCFVGEVQENDQTGEIQEKKVVGYALYYYTYSTWEGRSIYMEDLYVTPKYRNLGIGKALWKAVVEEGVKNKCARTDFAVLNWNKPSIEFYKASGSKDLTSSEGWHMFRLNEPEMKKLIQG